MFRLYSFHYIFLFPFLWITTAVILRCKSGGVISSKILLLTFFFFLKYNPENLWSCTLTFHLKTFRASSPSPQHQHLKHCHVKRVPFARIPFYLSVSSCCAAKPLKRRVSGWIIAAIVVAFQRQRMSMHYSAHCCRIKRRTPTFRAQQIPAALSGCVIR